MTPTLPDDADEWARAWHERLNDSTDFASAAADFEAAVLFVVEPDETYDGDPVRMVVDVSGGECLSAAAVDGAAASGTATDPDYDYALRGPYEAWTALLEGDLSVADAVMGGPFDVEGNTIALMSYREAFVEMVRAARGIDVEFAY